MQIIQRPETSEMVAIYKNPLIPSYKKSSIKEIINHQKHIFNPIELCHLPYIGNEYIPRRARIYSHSSHPPATTYYTHSKFKECINYDVHMSPSSLAPHPKASLNTSEVKETYQMKPSTSVCMRQVKKQRISSAYIKNKRPETRYKKNSMFADLGKCNKKNNFKIPIRKWGDDPYNKEHLPCCWLDPHIA